MPKPLPQLLQHTPHRIIAGNPTTAAIAAVRQDSRAIAPGDCFVAVPGFAVDGSRYLPEAIAAGAAALVVQADHRPTWEPTLAHTDLPVVEVENARIALADLAAAHHDFPARKLTVVGVTGTDGKTTTTWLTHALLSADNPTCGLINGLEFNAAGQARPNHTGETTPQADIIQPLLAEMVAARQTHVVIEASSHGLQLERLRHCDFDAAVFTGLSDDHLDFHQTRERYLAAKLRLFTALDAPSAQARKRFAVVRAEDPLRETIAAAHSRPTIIATSTAATSDVSVQALSRTADGAQIRAVTPSGALACQLRMPGDYNLANASLALAAAWNLGLGPAAFQRGFDRARPVPGRMEPIDAGQPFRVIVDAAATGPALHAALQALKPHIEGRLLLVVGVAGERDPARRSQIAQVAAQLADHTYITSENPRSEDPVQIVADIARAMRAAGAADRLTEEPDRRQAIRKALRAAQPNDLVLIAGKGAEPTLIFADRTEPWDDRQTTRQELANL